jgi:hypothetical protein
LNLTKSNNPALFEHRFWLQILGDHARFIFNALSPKENEEIERANCFIQVFDQLLYQSRKNLSDTEINSLNQKANQYAQEIRAFKLHLIKQHLLGEITIALPPTFINHMVNEVEEYLCTLGYLLNGQIPPKQTAVHYHLVWLQDAAGHAAGITAELDMVEKKLMTTSRAFTNDFEDFYIKAVEMAGYMRTHLSDFPALKRFNKEVEWEMILFKKFLQELEELELDAKALGTFSPLMADHMAREECYYLLKLSEVSEVEQPACDPTKPRTETKA